MADFVGEFADRRADACAVAEQGVGADGTARHRLSTSIVAFKRLEQAEIAAYLATGEWRGKAGGYAIQGRAEALIAWIGGSHSGVVGLPLYETVSLLSGEGFPVRFGWLNAS